MNAADLRFTGALTESDRHTLTRAWLPFLRRRALAAPPTETALPRPVPTSRSERVRLAFREQPMTPREERVLLAVMRHPGSTSQQLSAACGWRGSMWHTHFSAICKKRRAILSPIDPLEAQDDNEDMFLCGLLTRYDIDSCTFRLREDVEPILREMGVGP